MIINSAVWLTRVIAAIVSRRPIPRTMGKVDDRPDDERRHFTEEEKRNARGL
jgi:hypothetical protein